MRSVSNETQSIRVLRRLLYTSLSRSCLLLFAWSGSGQKREKMSPYDDRRVKPTNPPTLGQLGTSSDILSHNDDALHYIQSSPRPFPHPLVHASTDAEPPTPPNSTRSMGVFLKISIPAARSSALPHASSNSQFDDRANCGAWTSAPRNERNERLPLRVAVG